ncbi:hypothetical protein GWK17_21830 [Bacillus selenatarsenatis]|uniref:Uncharacterized protein n=1 Tax=Mesobacillus selenatarsenatis TaxID=388741 RepID=A0A846TMS5_9BACI|nr:hypothetical protein [Mesobacillus selenatarsenatis]
MIPCLIRCISSRDDSLQMACCWIIRQTAFE